MTDESFWEVSSDAAKYVLNYNPERPTHVFLRELIAGAVCGDKGGVEPVSDPIPGHRERKYVDA